MMSTEDKFNETHTIYDCYTEDLQMTWSHDLV